MPSPEWAVLDDPEVDTICRRAAEKVARHYETDADDLYQEARIYVATKTDLQECLDEESDMTLGTLSYRLERDLVNLAKEVRIKASRNTSYEERNRDSWDDTDAFPKQASIAIRTDVSRYTRELVESLLPAVWDDNYCYGVRAENAPDPDMPRGSTNKATSGSLAAHIADIKAGWAKAPLSVTERRTLLLAFGLDWSQGEIADRLGISQPTVSRALYAGVGKVVSCLNGDYALMFQLCEDCTCNGEHAGEGCAA